MRRATLTLAALLSAATPARAHDMWIQPPSAVIQPGDLVTVAIRVGHPGKGVDPVPRNPLRIVRFDAIVGENESAVLGQDGRDPAGFLRAGEPGLLTLIYRSNHARSELPADRFEAYLAEEGLTAIRELRRSSGQSQEPGRERYSRCLKALLEVGGGGAELDRPRGLTLELVAEADPFRLVPGHALPVRLLYESRPLAGALVSAFALDGEAAEIVAVTDPAGRVQLHLPRTGAWAITATHMIPLPAGSEVEFESFWASLTFALGPVASSTAAATGAIPGAGLPSAGHGSPSRPASRSPQGPRTTP